MITLYHRTAEDIARKILAEGFRDGTGERMDASKIAEWCKGEGRS